MRFTNSPYEKMMQQKPRPQAPAPAKPPRGSRCSGCPYWGAPGAPGVPTGAGLAACPATESLCGPRLAGGDSLARELTREEKRAIRALVTKWCANYDRECGCLPLDGECYMLGKCWTGALCRYFREAVLPLDPALEAALCSGSAAGLLLGGVCKESPPPTTAGVYAEKAGLGR